MENLLPQGWVTTQTSSLPGVLFPALVLLVADGIAFASIDPLLIWA